MGVAPRLIKRVYTGAYCTGSNYFFKLIVFVDLSIKISVICTLAACSIALGTKIGLLSL